MKKSSVFAFISGFSLFLIVAAAAVNRRPLFQAFLQSNLDANGFAITNLSGLGVFSIWTNDANGVWIIGNQTNLMLGFLAGKNNTGNASGAVILGVDPLESSSASLQRSVVIGNRTAKSSSASQNDAVLIGRDVGTNNTGTLTTTVGIGHAAFGGFSGSTAFDAIGIGNQSLSVSSGDAVGTVAIGAFSGASSTATMGLDVILGDTSGFLNSGGFSSTVAVGNEALSQNTASIIDCVFLGHKVQYQNIYPMTNSIVIGWNATGTRSNQFVLGHNISHYAFCDVDYAFPATGNQGIFTSDGAGNITWSINVVVAGTTNQIVFGATNLPPAVPVTVVKWVSVQVQGEAAAYRIPLYQ